MAVKLVGLDIDGTLLTSGKALTAATVRALAAAAERGVEPVLATGRLLSECTDLLKRLPMIHYAVTCTGAQVLDLRTGGTLARQPLTAAELRRLYGLLRPLDAMIQVFSDGDGRIHNRRSQWENAERFCGPGLAALTRQTHVPEDDLDAFVAGYTGSTNKLHIFFPSRAEKEKALALLEHTPYTLLASIPTDLEIMAPGVDKGTGLQALAEHLGLTAREVMAIGDGGNDAAMLRYAGTGVAMGNACPEALAAADRVTASNDEDGVAKAIWAILEEEGLL